MIFQEHNLIERMNVLSNVMVGRLGYSNPLVSSLYLFPHAEVRSVMDCLERVGLGGKEWTRTAVLSGGEKQRVGIARALAQQAKIVLADEPIASLDPATGRSILQLLKTECARSGMIVICSLHQEALALEFGERIIGIKQGVLVFDKPASELDKTALDQLYSGVQCAKL